jgi:hypothetical protein
MAKQTKKTEEKDVKQEETSTIRKKYHDLSEYKKERGYGSTKFKPQEWLDLPKAFVDATGIPGIPTGAITLIRGNSDTGKSSVLFSAAISAQKKGILPVFIVTEMKWSWEHAKLMGLEFDEVINEKGKKDYDGFFIYRDRGDLKTIEDVAAFINHLIDEQEKGLLKYDLCFFWDSIGSIPCQMSVEKGKNNNEWNAGAMSVQFGSHVNQRIVYSRKANYHYTNTLVCVNKIWVRKPDNPMGQPTMKNKGGDTMYYDSSLIITLGNIATSGVTKIKAVKNGKEVIYGVKVRVQIEKNHINGVSTVSKVIFTPTDIIHDEKSVIEKYKKENLAYFVNLLGETNGDDINIVVEEGEIPDNQYDDPKDDEKL